MWVWVDRVGGIALNASLSVTILMSFVALAMLGCRQPARRSRLARAGLVAALALIVLVPLAPLVVPQVDPLALVRDAGYWPHPILAPEALAWPLRLAGSMRWPLRIVSLLYLGTVAAGLGWLVLGHAGMRWLIGRSRAPSAATRAVYESLSSRVPPALPVPPDSALAKPVAPGRRPRLLVSDRIRRPVLAGLLRPTILVPAALDQTGSTDAIRLSLLHELAHAERADPWFSLAGSLAQAIWFFVPPLWWVRAQMRLDHEFLADRHAALAFADPGHYASSLLELAFPTDSLEAGTGPAASVGSWRPRSPLFQRVLMLVQCPFRVEADPPGWWSWSLSSLVVLAALATACLSIRATSRAIETRQATIRSDGRSSSSGPRVFRMARLHARASQAAPNGRALPVELPVRLPEQFDLTVDVWGDRAALASTRVAGYPLLHSSATSLIDTPNRQESWHRVQIHRDAGSVRISVDGTPVPSNPEPGGTTTWLALEPAPGRPGRFRNLTLTW